MYNSRIEIYQQSQERDAYNELIDKLVLVGIYWAQRTESGGRENLYASRIVHENEVAFTIRFATTIKAGMVVRYEDQDMKVLSTHEEGRRKFLHIKCLKSDSTNTSD